MHREQAARYICPGDSYPISRAVHLARLAAFYPKCRTCQHRHDVGQISRQIVERLEETEHRVQRSSLFSPEGVRGVYLNELNRQTAGRMAGAFASLLWDAAPLVGRSSEAAEPPRPPKRRGPSVVVGYDERPSSPDLMIGVTSALRRMGCHVIDIGLTTRPCFCFAVHHLQSTGGVFVTGAGCEPSWTGLDFVGRNARPYSLGGELGDLEARFQSEYARPTRHAGTHRAFQAAVPYQAGLWKHFHALRPLTLVVGSTVRRIRQLLEEMSTKLPCRLETLPLPTRSRVMDSPDDPDVLRIGRAVRERSADLGVLIDDDSCRTAVVDEQGRLVPDGAMLSAMVDLLHADQLPLSVVFSNQDDPELRVQFSAQKVQCISSECSWAALHANLLQNESLLGYAGGGRYFYREAVPVCDGVITLAHVLQILSRSDAPCSEVMLRSTGAPVP